MSERAYTHGEFRRGVIEGLRAERDRADEARRAQVEEAQRVQERASPLTPEQRELHVLEEIARARRIRAESEEIREELNSMFSTPSQEIEVDFSESGVGKKFNLVRDKYWVSKDHDVFYIPEMSDRHLKNILKRFPNPFVGGSYRAKAVQNVREELEERERSGKSVKEDKPKRRIKL